MESAFETNTGNKRLDSRIALALRQASAISQYLNLVGKNRAFATVISGTVVAAAGVIVASGAFTPKYTGKVRIGFFATWGVPGGGVVTPVLALTQGITNTPLAAFSQRGNVASGLGGAYETGGAFAALTPGTIYGVQLQTTAGDHAITLGQGAAVAGAGILIEELT